VTISLKDKIYELFQYKNMIYSYTHSEVRSRYKGSILGIFWALLNPVFILTIYGFVFSIIMRIQIENYFLFLFTGILPWFFFRSTMMASANVIIGNSSLIKKIYFPREILPFSTVFSQLVNYLIGLIVLIPILFIFDSISIHILMLPFIVTTQVILSVGLALILSSITVYLRDLRQILEVAMLAMFYATPILYQIDMVPERFHTLMNLNPMKPIIESYQNILFFNTTPNFSQLGTVALLSILLLYVGMVIFNYLNKGFVEKI
jgi:lipopolysaccharide transport system permease protein